MNGDRDNWADWWVGDWCPILGAVPEVEGMTEGDFAGQAANIIHRLRADFFGQSVRTVAESVRGANRTHDPKDDPAEPDPDRIAQARVIHREAMTIEKHALWALDTWRTTRDGQPESLRIAGVANECRDGLQSASVATFEHLLMTSVDRAFEFVLSFAKLRESPPPFKEAEWPVHDVLAILAIHASANVLHDMLADYRDQPMERRLRALLNAQALDRMAREYKAVADAKAEPSRRAQRGAGKSRPKARSPLRRALEVMAGRGLSTAEIIAGLFNEELSFDDESLPIVTFNPTVSIKDDGVLRWYPRGYPGQETSTPIKTIQNLLSEVRKDARKSRNPD